MKHLIFALAIFLTAAGVHAQNRTTFKTTQEAVRYYEELVGSLIPRRECRLRLRKFPRGNSSNIPWNPEPRFPHSPKHTASRFQTSKKPTGFPATTSGSGRSF